MVFGQSVLTLLLSFLSFDLVLSNRAGLPGSSLSRQLPSDLLHRFGFRSVT